jgi:hypothetical protein
LNAQYTTKISEKNKNLGNGVAFAHVVQYLPSSRAGVMHHALNVQELNALNIFTTHALTIPIKRNIVVMSKDRAFHLGEQHTADSSSTI